MRHRSWKKGDHSNRVKSENFIQSYGFWIYKQISQTIPTYTLLTQIKVFYLFKQTSINRNKTWRIGLTCLVNSLNNSNCLPCPRRSEYNIRTPCISIKNGFNCSSLFWIRLNQSICYSEKWLGYNVQTGEDIKESMTVLPYYIWKSCA